MAAVVSIAGVGWLLPPGVDGWVVR
uniref:Uncharacterized protein n=1 Tax=Arundo donax TaxID=35708 RepID=A0A0A8YEE7_ARUDO